MVQLYTVTIRYKHDTNTEEQINTVDADCRHDIHSVGQVAAAAY